MRALVSVVVRSIDRPELQEALTSLARQTCSAIEVVLVDAVGAHAPPQGDWPFPLKLVTRGERLIRSRAANLGLDNASGRYVMFLDDDDLFLPEHVERLVAALEGRPDCRAAYAGVRVEGAEGVIDIYDAEFDPCRLIAWNHLPTAGVMLERSLATEGARFDEALDLYEDWDFWLQVASRTPLARSPGVSAVWRAGLGHSGMMAPQQSPELVAARRYVQAKWLRTLAPEGFERLVESFRAEVAERDFQLAQAEHRETDFRTQEQELNRMLRGERQELEAWRREAQAAMTGLREQHAAREAAERRAEDLERELALFRTSTSWKLTAPLRQAVKFVRGAPDT